MMAGRGGKVEPWPIGETRTQDDLTWYNNRLCQYNNNYATATPPYTVFSTHYRATDLIDIEGSNFSRTPNSVVSVPSNAKYMQLSQGKDSGRDLNLGIKRLT